MTSYATNGIRKVLIKALAVVMVEGIHRIFCKPKYVDLNESAEGKEHAKNFYR